MHTRLSIPPDPLEAPVDVPVGDARACRPRYPWLALLLAGPLLLLVLQIFPSLDQSVFHGAPAHLLITLVASVLGVALALLVLHVARRAQDARVFLVGMGFFSTASILMTHSISTPDVLMSGRGLATSISALLSLVLGNIFFALSGLSLVPSIDRWLIHRARILLLVYVIFWLVYNWLFLVTIPTSFSAQAPARPVAGGAAPATSYAQLREDGALDPHAHATAPPAQSEAPALALPLLDVLPDPLALIGLLCCVFAIARHYHLYRRLPSPAGRAITCGIALFGEALLTQRFAQVYTVSFWLYHVQEFSGFGVISYAVLGAYHRGQAGESLFESLFLSRTRARLQAGYVSAMDALVAALSRGEQPTAELREALRARFGLAESQVQALERAALAVAQERRQRQELERLNQELRQLEEHKSQLIQMIVHDLKNPLTALIGFIEILHMDHPSPRQRVLLASALRSGRNLSGLIGDLLDVGRIEAGRLELDPSLIAPRDLLHDCADEMRGWLAQDGKTLVVESPDDLPLLCADLRLMRRVILNLLSNAIKHTPPGTSIVLRATPAVGQPAPGDEDRAGPPHVVVEVEDDGPGIAPDRLERIFDRFGRFSSEPNARQDSTGLGLTLCRLVVEAHGGQIGVSSVVGRGATFRVTLPVV